MQGVPAVLIGFERLIVLVIVALLISRAMAGLLDRRREAAGAVRGALDADLDALESTVERQGREIASLAAAMDLEADPPPITPAQHSS